MLGLLAVPSTFILGLPRLNEVGGVFCCPSMVRGMELFMNPLVSVWALPWFVSRVFDCRLRHPCDYRKLLPHSEGVGKIIACGDGEELG